MNESTNNKTRERKAKNIVPVEIEGLEDFNAEETARLLKVKADIASGRYSDITEEHRKLLFVQWLVEHGKLSS
jgi:hypothetical protein